MDRCMFGYRWVNGWIYVCMFEYKWMGVERCMFGYRWMVGGEMYVWI